MKWLIGIGIALVFALFLWFEHWVSNCPICGSPLDYWSYKKWYCTNEECGWSN